MTATQEFVDVLNEIKGTKNGVSGSRIRRLTDIAVHNIHSESQIMPEVLSNIRDAAVSHKLGALYVLDSIAKAFKSEAEKNGQVVTPNATEGTYAAGLVKLGKGLKDAVDITVNSVPEDQKEKVFKLVEIWNKDHIFPPNIISQVKGETDSQIDVSSAYNAPGFDGSSVLKNLASLDRNGNSSSVPSSSAATAAAGPSSLDLQAQQAAMVKMLQNLQQTGQLPNIPQPPQMPVMPQMPQGFPAFPMPPQQPANGFPFGQHGDNGNSNARYNNNNVGSGFSQQDAFNQFKSSNNRDTRGNMRERDNKMAYSRRGDRNRSRSPPRRDQYGGNGNNRFNNNNSNSNNRNTSKSLNGTNEKNIPGTPHYRPRNYSVDPNLPNGSIKVFSRTIFIGGVPSHMDEQELATVLRPYAEVQSVILNIERKHAFVKVYSRKEAEEVISSFSRSQNTMGLRTRWGVGFGPRDCCDYQHGVSMIPIARLTDADKRWITMAEWGGIGPENHLTAGFVMEEPDIEIGDGVTSKAISKKMPTDGSRNGPRSTKPGEPDDLYTDPLNKPQAPAFLQNQQGRPNLLQGLFGNGGAPTDSAPPPPGLATFSSQQYSNPPPPSASVAPSASDASSQLANLMAMLQQQKK